MNRQTRGDREDRLWDVFEMLAFLALVALLGWLFLAATPDSVNGDGEDDALPRGAQNAEVRR